MAGSTPVGRMVPGPRLGPLPAAARRRTEPRRTLLRTSGMTTLIVIGFVSGLVTALSPCVLPVLPVVLTTSVTRGEPSR